MIGQQAPYGVCSGILQASDAEDKENVCPENNTDWLHKNYNYVRTRQPTSHTSCVPNSLTSHNLFNATATPGAVTPNFKDKIECAKLVCAQESITHTS